MVVTQRFQNRKKAAPKDRIDFFLLLNFNCRTFTPVCKSSHCTCQDLSDSLLGVMQGSARAAGACEAARRNMRGDNLFRYVHPLSVSTALVTYLSQHRETERGCWVWVVRVLLGKVEIYYAAD